MNFLLSASLALLGAVSAAPAGRDTSPAHAFVRRDVCDGVNAEPILYHDYYGDACPPILSLNADGSCPGQTLFGNDCASFCQIKTTFYYGTEAPVQNTYCHGPFTCTVTDTQTVTITKAGTINLGWSKGFQAGITGNYQYADATAHATAFQIKLDAGVCGYFTVVPTFRSSCGSVTDGKDFIPDGNNPYGGAYVCVPKQTHGNICVPQQRLLPDGSAQGTTIFVYTDCVTTEPLPMDKQDPIYNQPGVPLDRGTYDALAENWKSIGEASQGLSYSTPQCGANPYTMPVADVTTASDQLDAIGDQNCCSQTDGSCVNVTAVNGRAVDLCGRNDGVQLCANCARVANYVAGLRDCVDGNGNVGAIQDIVETPGLTVQI